MSFEKLLRHSYLVGMGIMAIAPLLGTIASADVQQDSTALYGEPIGKASESIQRVKPVGYSQEDWKNSTFYYIQTELSPSTLYYSKTNSLSFFTNMGDYGLSAPTYATYMTQDGCKIVKSGEAIDSKAICECWILVWFAGAKGWTDWDSPCVVYLQKRPISVKLDQNGLAFEFSDSAGYAVFLPLYGYYKPPQENKKSLATFNLQDRNIQTWEWSNGIKPKTLERIRYWAKVSREFPIYCEDSFSVDRSNDTVTIRQRFEWISIDDEWKTPHLKLAPVSPVLALASMDSVLPSLGGTRKAFPVEFSKPVKDVGIFTPYGPYVGIEETDTFDATFHVLQYINEMEAYDPPKTDVHPTVQTALDKLRATANSKFPNPDSYEYDHGGLGNFCWAIMGDQWYAKGIPYYEREMQRIAAASLKRYFHDDVLVKERFKEREYPKGSGRTYLILEGPGIGSWGVLGDAGKFSTNMLETLWTYSHYTNDWELIKERWDMIKKLFCTATETRWVSFGRDAIAEMGDESAPCLAYARMAYKVGDMDTYDYACYMFTRELVHHWVKQHGAQYFRLNQPWHSMEFMPEEVYLTNLWGDTAGWQIDGPTYPEKTGERQYTNRWVRFKSEDVGRFYRDYLKDDVKKELDLLNERWEPKRRYINDSHIMPSMVQLRSLLLNETPEELAKIATPDKFGGPASGVIASCISVLRTSHPTRYVRLIPKGEPTPYVAGLEREVSSANPYLAQAILSSIQDEKPKTIWPLITWWGWRTPSDYYRWAFGHVVPVKNGNPVSAKNIPINWNTLVVTYVLP
jgi:hypothetical protein